MSRGEKLRGTANLTLVTCVRLILRALHTCVNRFDLVVTKFPQVKTDEEKLPTTVTEQLHYFVQQLLRLALLTMTATTPKYSLSPLLFVYQHLLLLAKID